jgi:hypothetical protein
LGIVKNIFLVYKFGMNKSILYILILCCLPSFFWANSLVDLKLPVYSKKFSDNTIPSKYKRESAVILVQEFHFVALSSQSYLFMKQKVLVNDMDGVDAFKNIYFAKGFKEDTVLITKKNGETHFVKFTPDNGVLENNPTHFTFNEREIIFQYQKMELKDLEEGDLVEFWYKIPVDYSQTKSFNFNNSIVYPIINRTICILHQDNFVVNARYFSSDYKFKTLQKNINQQINVIEFKDLEKSVEAFNIPITHKNPGLLLALSSAKLPKYQLLTPDKFGAINEVADMEQIKKNVHQRVLANTKILELKNKILYYSTIANFGGIRDTDEKRKVAAAFYIFRDQVFNHSKLKEMDIDLFFYYCLKVCKANRWKYQIGFTYPKSYQLPTQILSMEDVHYFIEIEGLRIFPSLKNPHQELKFIPIETQGSLAYSTDFKKKYRKLKWLGSSIPYVDNNVISSEKKVNIDLLNGKLLVRDSVYAFNYGKLFYQKELFKDVNFYKTDYKHAGIRPAYTQSKKTSEEISAEKKAEKLHLDSVYNNYKMFLRTKGIPVDSLWNLNIKEEGRSEKYEKRIHITEYSTNALQLNKDNLVVSISDLLGDEILCNNNELNPELGNLFFNYNKTYTIKLTIPKGYNVADNLINKELNNNYFINSISYEVKQNELVITVNHQVKNHKYPTKNWKEHLDFCLATQVYYNQKIYFQKN